MYMEGIGTKTKRKIEEIIKTKKLKQLEFFENDPKVKSLRELVNIWGVGESSANILMKKGISINY